MLIPAHRADVVQDWLRAEFGTQWVSKEFWPPRSSDLNPCDSFLWGYLKARVYNPLPTNLEELQKNREREIHNIPKTMLKSVFLNLKKTAENAFLQKLVILKIFNK